MMSCLRHDRHHRTGQDRTWHPPILESTTVRNHSMFWVFFENNPQKYSIPLYSIPLHRRKKIMPQQSIALFESCCFGMGWDENGPAPRHDGSDRISSSHLTFIWFHFISFSIILSIAYYTIRHDTTRHDSARFDSFILGGDSPPAKLSLLLLLFLLFRFACCCCCCWWWLRVLPLTHSPSSAPVSSFHRALLRSSLLLRAPAMAAHFSSRVGSTSRRVW